ncbi:MAG: hypothetical protein GY725_23420 [bacterium]|nr:hypothetical protein [bacterium]
MEQNARHSETGLQPPMHIREGAAFKLYIGCEVIEVRFDARGICFRHADRSDTEGFLPWDTAIALSLLPEEMKRTS